MEAKVPLKVKCLSSRYGCLSLDAYSDVKDAITGEWDDKEVYINQAFVTEITFGYVKVEIHSIHEVPSQSTGCYKEDYFTIHMFNGVKYRVRKKYWEKFYEDWTGVISEEKLQS